MDGLLVVLGLVVLAVPVSIIVLLIGHSGLKSRLLALQDRVARLEADAKDQRHVAPVQMTIAAPEAGPMAAQAPPPIESPTPFADIAAMDVPAPEPEPAPALMPKDGPIVMRADRASALGVWLQRNWIYVVSAASLGLAGVFLVQYSVQNGLLPPWARVVAAYLLGAALVVAGEWLRRRSGDGEASTTAYLPSVFAGAGLVTLFASTIAARQLYGLIGPDMTFVLLLLTAALAIGLGWFYGPLLVAVGLIGATLAPFLVGSNAGPTPLLYGYYALIAATGLAIDAMRRWAWVSVLALVLGYAGAALMLAGDAGEGGWLIFLLAMPVLAVVLPPLRLIPDHAGRSTLEALIDSGKAGWPQFPTRLAAGTVLVSSLGLLILPGQTALVGLLALAALTVLALTLLIWAEKADGLADLALVPAAAFVLRLWFDATQYWPLSYGYMSASILNRPPETAAPMEVTWIVVLATLITAAFAYRALRGGPLSLVHGLAAVLVAPVSVALLELTWQPALVMGAFPWALHSILLGAAMVALAARFARTDGDDHRRMAYATLSALSLIALALFLLTSATALTLALGVLAMAAAWLDRRFTLREMGLFVQVAVAVLSYRLLIDPGLDWAADAPLGSVLLAFVGTIAAQCATLWLLKDKDRIMTSGVLESAAMALTAVLANVLLSRWILPFVSFTGASAIDVNYATTLQSMPWLVFALTQAFRVKLGGPLRRLRMVLAALGGVLAAAGLLVSAIPLNPLFIAYPDGIGAMVVGPMIFDTLALSYAMPGLILLAAAWRGGFARWLTLGLLSAGSALLVLYAGLEIRRFWQGDWLGVPGVSQYELYSYTIALMVVGAALLYQAIAKRSTTLRRLGMAVIAVTIAKVFLIDASGLTGLTRVFSFLGLGLSLAGLAWLNRWAGQVSSK